MMRRFVVGLVALVLLVGSVVWVYKYTLTPPFFAKVVYKGQTVFLSAEQHTCPEGQLYALHKAPREGWLGKLWFDKTTNGCAVLEPPMAYILYEDEDQGRIPLHMFVPLDTAP